MPVISQTTTRSDRIHATLMLLAALLTAAYWAVYFTSGDTQLRQDAVYLGFENAFPLADGWMALCYLLGGIALLQQRPTAVLWGLCGGSAMIFLASMDMLFNFQQGHFALALTAPLLLHALDLLGPTQWTVLMAGSALLAAPVLLVFVAVQPLLNSFSRENTP